MRTWAWISSLRQLIKISLKNVSDMPFVLKDNFSNVAINIP
jgi:hypothetical protein